MPRPKFDRDAAYPVYCNLMAEIKTRNRDSGRLIADRFGSSGSKLELEPALVAQSCYLQLRMICELIAVASLIAQGEAEGAWGGLLDEYHAEKIIKGLGKRAPEFFPRPFVFEPHRPSEAIQLRDADEPFMSRPELLRLYHQCGDFLHLPSAQELLEDRRRVLDVGVIVEHFRRIALLLRRHRIKLANGDEIWVDMSPSDDPDSVLAMLMVDRPDDLSGNPPWAPQLFITPEGQAMVMASRNTIEF